MQVVITGGAGFIGGHLAELLVSEGHKVTVYDNFTTGREENLAGILREVRIVEADIRDTERISRAFFDKDIVVHLAAMVSVGECRENPRIAREINSIGTKNVLDAAHENKIKRLIYASTSAVYGDDPELPKTEQSPIKPMSMYASTKLDGEQAVRNCAGLENVTLRLLNVYGPRQNPESPYSGVISKFITKLLRHQQPIIYGDGTQTRDFVYVTDVVDAIFLAITKPQAAGETFNIATGTQTSVNQVFSYLKQLTGSSVKPGFGPRPRDDILHSVADISKANKILDYAPKVSIREGLEKTLASYQ